MYQHTTVKYENISDMIAPNKKCWDYFVGSQDSEIHIFEDSFLREHEKYDDKIKIAWYKENPNIYDYSVIFSQDGYNPYRYLLENHDKFDYVISSFRHLKNIVGEEKFMYCPVMGSRIELDKYGIYEKDKMLSIVASGKDWTIGHRLRHWVINKFKDKIDVYGNGYNNEIDKHGEFGKIYSLASYYFSIAIMNSKWDGYFTEVLTDCIATGTIPIYYGSDDIDTYFNPDGIIQFTNIAELEEIIKTLSPELYSSKIKAVEENLEISRRYITEYDYLYHTYKSFFDKLQETK